MPDRLTNWHSIPTTSIAFSFPGTQPNSQRTSLPTQTSPTKGENCFGIIAATDFYPFPHKKKPRKPQSRHLFASFGAFSCHVRFVCCFLIYNFLRHFILLLFRSITATSARYLSVKFRGERTCLPAAFYSCCRCCFRLDSLSLGRLISKAWKIFPKAAFVMWKAATRKGAPCFLLNDVKFVALLYHTITLHLEKS